jgi:methionyl-tRNA formyltransferase
MKMDAGLDTGPMLLTREIEICRGETGGQLHDRLAGLGAEAVVAAIEGWTGGRLVAQPQPAEGATYAAKLRKDEAVIDWSRSAAELERLVLAFNPWPVAETSWRGQQLRIWRATCVAGEPPEGARPGRVTAAADGRILVATGHGTLQLDTLQLPGRKPTAAADFLKANALAGCQLGRTDG